MMQTLIRAWWWLLGGLAFFTVFAFALNNREQVTLHWFFGYQSQIQLVLLVLLTLMLGVFLGAMAVLPLWWRQYHQSRITDAALAQLAPATAAPSPAVALAPKGKGEFAGDEVVDAV